MARLIRVIGIYGHIDGSLMYNMNKVWPYIFQDGNNYHPYAYELFHGLLGSKCTMKDIVYM